MHIAFVDLAIICKWQWRSMADAFSSGHANELLTPAMLNHKQTVINEQALAAERNGKEKGEVSYGQVGQPGA